MHNFLLLPPHLQLLAIVMVVAFVVVAMALLFGWAARRAVRLEHAQQSIDAIRWPASVATAQRRAPYARKPQA